MNNCLLLRRKIGQIVSFRSEPSSPLMSILCGVIGAVAVVFLVIIITMKVGLLLIQSILENS